MLFQSWSPAIISVSILFCFVLQRAFKEAGKKEFKTSQLGTMKGVSGLAFYMRHVPGLASGVRCYCLSDEMK